MSHQESSGDSASNGGALYFEKQRDLLIQEIATNIDNVIFNLDILNRSLNESIQVGKEFDDVGRLWANFYDGVNQLKEKRGEKGDDEEETEGQGEDQVQSASGEQEEQEEQGEDEGHGQSIEQDVRSIHSEGEEEIDE
ncbi:DASH complex subunit Dad1-domain-containing protein [Scheffersomyces amazonensis]|uniref:DASH complex subunit Dad1-domain-containing protein n=1 Tax=Scheffersomyces amazonensis TaxID=1078765 RepID=UPI00315D5EBE